MQDTSDTAFPAGRHSNGAMLDTVDGGAAWNQRRLQVVDACAAVLANEGFERTRTVDLCQATHLEEPTLLSYVESKQALLLAIHGRLVEELVWTAAPICEADASPPDQLEQLGRQYAEVLVRFDHHLRVVIHSYAVLVAVQPERLVARRTALEAAVGAIIEAGIESGDFRDLDVTTSVRAWLGLLLASSQIAAGRPPLPRSRTAIVEDIFIRGVRA